MVKAGVGAGMRTFRATAPSDFRRIVDVKLNGAVNTVRTALGQDVAAQGQFILVSSVMAFNNGALQSPCAIAKAGIEALSRSLQIELAPHQVDVATACFATSPPPCRRRSGRTKPPGDERRRIPAS